MDYTYGGLTYTGAPLQQGGPPLQQGAAVNYGRQPIVTAGQDWTKIVPVPKAGEPDLFAGFSQWAAFNGITPEDFQKLTDEEKAAIRDAFLNRNNPPKPEAAPLFQSRRRR